MPRDMRIDPAVEEAKAILALEGYQVSFAVTDRNGYAEVTAAGDLRRDVRVHVERVAVEHLQRAGLEALPVGMFILVRSAVIDVDEPGAKRDHEHGRDSAPLAAE